MNNINNYIEENETILSSYGEKFYATNKRIFVLEKEQFEEYSYNNINSIKYKKDFMRSLLYFGIILFFIGSMFSIYGLTMGANHTLAGLNSLIIFTFGGIGIMFISILFMVMSALFDKSYYLITMSNRKNIKIPGKEYQKDIESFINTIRQQEK